jgi:hypothetical protein
MRRSANARGSGAPGCRAGPCSLTSMWKATSSRPCRGPPRVPHLLSRRSPSVTTARYSVPASARLTPKCSKLCSNRVGKPQIGTAQDRIAIRRFSAGIRKIWRDSREDDPALIGLANRRLQPLGHLTARSTGEPRTFKYVTPRHTRKRSYRDARRVKPRPTNTTRTLIAARLNAGSGSTGFRKTRPGQRR